MRAIVLRLLAVAALSLASCRCSPATPVPITMRVRNTSALPIYVDATQHRLGLTLERSVGGQRYDFDDLACPCRYCENACTPCAADCADGGALVQRLDPGSAAERSWDGVVQVSGTSRCGGEPCLDRENAPPNESFALRLCFTTQRPTGSVAFDDGGFAVGQFEASAQTCTTKSFMLQDGIVEIGPERGAACASASDCPGAGELCFSGSCTTGCPENDYPQPGAAALQILVSNATSFAAAASARGTQYTGVGTVTASSWTESGALVTYLGGLPNGLRSASLSLLGLTASTPGLPLAVGSSVSVVLIDNGQAGGQANRALVLRDAASGALVLAADTAQGQPLLTDADLAPFSIASGVAPVGCWTNTCGRFVYAARRLVAGGRSVDVEPGRQGHLVLSQGTWTLANINDGAFAASSCDVTELRPWVLWRSSTP